MNNPAKMIIITSNEDLIEQFSLNQSDKTRIIDLNENNLTPSISKDNNNLVDLTFLTQLSELNPNNDQMYKRVLDSPLPNRSKLVKTSKKGFDLVCVICEDRAIGFNYDALTCASCKAFFRRNAQYNPEKLRCLTGQKKCLVNHDIHRKCQRCRLEKCLIMGMRKDFILSEEEKQKRRERIEENRQLASEHQPSRQFVSFPVTDYVSESIAQIDQLLMDLDNDNIVNPLCEGLSTEDWSDIESIRCNYLSVFENETGSSCKYDLSDRISALVSWSEFVSEKVLKLIHFCQHIDEFESLNGDDRFILIKYNLLPLYIVHRTLYYNLLNGAFENIKKDDLSKRRQFFTLCYGTSGIRESFGSIMRSFSKLTEQDPTLTNLLLVVLLFSKGLSMNENEPRFNDEFAVHRAQSHYTRLTWNYLIYKQGEIKASRQFGQILSEIGRIQSLTKSFRDFFRKELQSKDELERVAPLMQAVLNIV